MLSTRSIRAWAWVHKWSSLVCTVFMLLCLTGLPLIFHHEIGHLLGTEVEAPQMPAGTPRADLDQVVAVAQARAPGKTMQFLSREIDDDSFWYVTLGDTPLGDEKQKTVAVDARAPRCWPSRSSTKASCTGCSSCTSTCSRACRARCS